MNFTGRYLTPDPIKLAGGLNNYQYLPNPTGWVEPLGLNPTRPGGTLLEGGFCTHFSRRLVHNVSAAASCGQYHRAAAPRRTGVTPARN
nr:RHS repeat-associated core domain-containing protein [Pseudomonas saxonica]